MHQAINLQDFVNKLSFGPIIQIALWGDQDEKKMIQPMYFLVILLELAFLPIMAGKHLH